MPNKIDPADPELRARVLEALRAMAGDKAPSKTDWQHAQRDGLPVAAGLPSAAWIAREWGWSAIVRAAGMTPQQSKDGQGGPDDPPPTDIDAPLEPDEAHAWLCGIFALSALDVLPGGLPVIEPPRRLDDGRWAWRVR